MARILALTPQLPYPPQQGTTIRNFNLLAGLAQRHSIDLLTLIPQETEIGRDGIPSSAAALAEMSRYCRQLVTEPAPVRTNQQRARDALFSSLPDMAWRLESPALHRQMHGLLAENHYDVVQVEGIEMAPYVLRWLEGTHGSRPRVVFDDHNAEYVLQQRAFLTDVRHPARWLPAAYSLLQWRKLMRYERGVCLAADRVAAVSEVDRASLQRLVPGLDVAVVPNGVDLALYRPGAVPPMPGLGPQALVFTGKMDYRPNVDAVLWFVDTVLPLVLAEAPDAHFYIVGQQPHARLSALASRPGITITGRVPDPRPYIAGAAVYVVPLRIGGGTRLKVLEAMAMGQAIVSTPVGCDGFPVGDGQEVCLASTPADFAARVTGLLRERGRAAELGRRARHYVEAHYGWEAIIPHFERLYC